MKALTLHQPWASLIALGVKTIETRSWSTMYRGPLTIHAGAKKPTRICSQDEAPPIYDSYAIDRYLNVWEDINVPGQYAYWRGPLGAIVATSRLVDCLPIKGLNEQGYLHFVCPQFGWNGLTLLRFGNGEWEHPTTEDDITDQRPCGDFTPGRFAWLLEDIKPVEPPVPARGHQGLWEWAA